jgi:hypothetical protein
LRRPFSFGAIRDGVAVVDDVGNGRLKAIIDKPFAPSETAAAHVYIESRKAAGGALCSRDVYGVFILFFVARPKP